MFRLACSVGSQQVPCATGDDRRLYVCRRVAVIANSCVLVGPTLRVACVACCLPNLRGGGSGPRLLEVDRGVVGERPEVRRGGLAPSSAPRLALRARIWTEIGATCAFVVMKPVRGVLGSLEPASSRTSAHGRNSHPSPRSQRQRRTGRRAGVGERAVGPAGRRAGGPTTPTSETTSSPTSCPAMGAPPPAALTLQTPKVELALGRMEG